MKHCFKKPAKHVSKRMKGIKSQGTGLEKEMEKIFRNLKIKYQRQPELRGKPDFGIQGTNVLIFCDSSFWHGKREKEVSGKAFKRNRALWVEKLTKNKKRDERNNRTLRRAGWSVWRFWDSDILRHPDKVKKRLRRAMNASKSR
jgi:DNA mismatch endonuclease (patch repair protein)